VLRLVGLWTEPADVDAFERDDLGSHVPNLQRLPACRDVRTSRCIDGPIFRLTEVQFESLDRSGGDPRRGQRARGHVRRPPRRARRGRVRRRFLRPADISVPRLIRACTQRPRWSMLDAVTCLERLRMVRTVIPADKAATDRVIPVLRRHLVGKSVRLRSYPAPHRRHFRRGRYAGWGR